MSCPWSWESNQCRGPRAPGHITIRPQLPARHNYQSTMVRHNPGIPMASQSSWSGASSLEGDNPGQLTGTGNLHGVIGEHRRTSRSSSSSSSTNSSGGLEMAYIAASRCEQVGDFIETLSAPDAILSHSAPDFEPAETRARFDTSDFGFIGTQSTSDSSRQGRPITSQNSRANLFSSQGAPQGFNMNMHQLMSEPVFPSNHFDYLNSPLNIITSSDADTGLHASFQSTSSTYPGGPIPSGFANSASGQYSQGNPGMHNRSNKVYSSQGVAVAPPCNNAPGAYPYNRQGREYSFGQPGKFQAFPSQDFSLPPPTQSWHGTETFMPESSQRVTCSRCNEKYKWPHVLDCLHVYCYPCLYKLFDPIDKSIVCPDCSLKTSLVDGPSSLKLDFRAFYTREVNIFSLNCTACTRDKEAIITCTTCTAYLCSDCRDGHKNMNQFQSHVLSAITKIGKGPDGNYVVFCDKHPSEIVTRYCMVCETVVCSLCLPEHPHPEYTNTKGCPTLEEVHPIVADRLNNLNEDCEIKYKDAEEILKQIPNILENMESRKRSRGKQIDEYYEYCKTVMEQNYVAAHDMLNKTFNQMMSEVRDWTSSVAKVAKDFKTVSVFNNQTVKLGVPYATVILMDKMEGGYKAANEHYLSVNKSNESLQFDLKFDPNYKDTHTMLNQNFLAICYIFKGAEKKVTPSVGNDRIEPSRRSFSEYTLSNVDHSDTNYQCWSAAPNTMSISTWNRAGDREKKNGVFIPQLNRNRTKTSFTHMFGEYGHGQQAFTEPSGQAYFQDGSYVICDTNNHRIVYYSASHEYIRTIGQHPNVPPLVAEEYEQRNMGLRNKGIVRHEGCLYFPNRVAICPLTQNIVATERPPSHDIQIFTVTGDYVRCFGGSILQHPRGVTVDEDGVIIVVECKVMKLVMFNQDGSFISSYSLAKDVEFPNDVAARDKKIFISDNRGHCVHVFNYNAEFLYKIGNEHITFFPIGVSVNHLNQVVVTDNHNTFNITVFDIAGTVLHVFESVNKLAQCHNVALHPSSLELILTTKDCSVYFFNYDPEIAHPLTPLPNSKFGHGSMAKASFSRRPRGNLNGSLSVSSFY